MSIHVSELPEVTDGAFRKAIRDEQKNTRKWAKRFIAACESGDVEALLEVADALNNETVGGWASAFRRLKRAAHPDIRQAFVPVWIENKSIAADFESLVPLIKGLRHMFPPYTGAPVRLYRGEFAKRWPRKKFGISWTSHLAVAEKFATDMRQCSDGGSVIIETLAPAEAIVAELGSHYDEHEFLVDRRRLGKVTVRAQFSQAEPKTHAAAMWVDPDAAART